MLPCTWCFAVQVTICWQCAAAIDAMIIVMVGLIADAWWVMQIVFYNPLTASTRDRLMQVSVEFKRVDVVVFNASGERTFDKDSVMQLHMPHHVVFRHGWHRGSTEANKDAASLS